MMTPSVNNSRTSETCMFFIDDSNIWIEAQKFAASGNSHLPKLIGRVTDPRLRIHVGRLVDTLRKDRIQGPSFLYGSRPPPNDSVWDVFKRFGFDAKIYDRTDGGKEKEVDNSMATDLTDEAVTLRTLAQRDEEYKQVIANTTFVVITGDRDLLPPVKRVLQCNIKVELWAWRSGMSKAYRRLDLSEGLFSINFLDDIFKEISFTAYRSTRNPGEVDGGRAIVLRDSPGEDEGEDEVKGKSNLESVVGDQLLQLGRLFFVTRSQSGLDLFIEFPDAKAEDIEKMLSKMQKLESRGLFGTMKVLSWPEYNSRFKKDAPDLVPTGNMFGLLADEDPGSAATKGGGKLVQNPVSPSSSIAEPQAQGGQDEQGEEPNDNPWNIVSRRDAGKTLARRARKDNPCPSGIRCEKAGDCGLSHAESERKLFRDHPNQQFKYWKAKKCAKPNCRQGKNCPYAHAQEEAWCLNCKVEGHSKDECPFER